MFNAGETDPVRSDPDRRHTITGAWEDKHVNWPGASTVGVNAFNGIYASWGGFAPRGQRGFTVYRPRHWAFAGTGLHYADQFGQEANIFGYEVDGLDYTFRNGLPYPVKVDGVPEGIEILAMAPATFAEDEVEGPGHRYYVHDSDYEGALAIAPGDAAEARALPVRLGHDGPHAERTRPGADRRQLRMGGGPRPQRVLYTPRHPQHHRAVLAVTGDTAAG